MLRKKTGIREIITGCIAHKSKYKEILYKTYYGYLMAIVIRYTHNKDEAEEVVNDAFVKIFKNLYKFEIHEQELDAQKLFKAWMARICSRTAIDFLRSKSRIFPSESLEDHDHPITAATSNLEVGDILKLLNCLPETQKLVFNLFEIEGYKHDEIATLLDIPESTSRVYLARAKSKLRTLYLEIG